MHETPKIRKKKLTAVYETQVTREINMSQEEGGRHSGIKEWFKWKVSHYFSYISEFQKIVQNFDKMFPEGNFEHQFQTFNAL